MSSLAPTESGLNSLLRALPSREHGGGSELAAVTEAREDRQTSASAPSAPRGSPPPPQRPRFRPSRAWIVFFLALLAINFYVSTRATQPSSRVRVPYSPFFLQQVTAGHVKEITSKGTAIQGTFTQKERYAGSKATTLFKTEVPAFADTSSLFKTEVPAFADTDALSRL